MAWRQQKRDVLDVQVYGVTFLLYRCVLSQHFTAYPYRLRRRYAALEEVYFAMCRRDRRCGC